MKIETNRFIYSSNTKYTKNNLASQTNICNKNTFKSLNVSKKNISNNCNIKWLLTMGTAISTIVGKTFMKNDKTSSIENTNDVIRTYNFKQHGKDGIPLKYPRKNFINDIKKVLESVPENKQAELLAKFDLSLGENDIDGIPTIDNFVPIKKSEEKIFNLITKFYNNKTSIKDPKAKKVFNNILKQHPEFAMTIGKPQHQTHIYSVDIHSLETLKKVVSTPEYENLSEEDKIVAQYAILMHDYGKKGNVITRGHATLSKDYAEKILDKKKDLNPETKDRILKLILHHHWFEGYNLGYLTAENIAKDFVKPEDRKIAIMMAKGDFESVKPTFHLRKLVKDKELTPEEYEETFKSKMENLYKDMEAY